MDEHPSAGTVLLLMKNDDTDGLKTLHDTGKWTDVNMAVHSMQDGNAIHATSQRWRLLPVTSNWR